MERKDKIESREIGGKLIYRLKAELDASPEIVWKKISSVNEIKSWDSMIMEIEGEIKNGGKVALRSAISPEQKFKLKISDLVPNRQMTWSSGMYPLFRGVRQYKLNDHGGRTGLVVEEVFDGWLLRLMKNKLPDCETLFGTYARDLKRALC